MKKKFSLLITLIMSTLVLYACSSNSSKTSTTAEKKDSSPIKIAGIFSTSGTGAPLGSPEAETLKMLVDQQNAKGGINGRKIELISYDEKSDQNEAVLNMKKAVTQDDVTAVIGGTLTGNSLAQLPLAEQYQVPYFSVAASQQVHTKEDGTERKWVFKVTQDDSQAVEKVLQYLKSKNLKKVAWLNVANSFGTGGHAEFKKMAGKYGVTPVIEDEFDATVKDAKPMLTRVKKADPQAIIVWGTVQESSVVIKNIKELEMNLPVIGSHGIGSQQLLDLAGDAANGVLFPSGKLIVADQLPDSDPQKKVLLDYKKMYEDKYHKPVSLFGAHTFDSFNMLKQAIEKKGTDKAAIRDYLENDIHNFVATNAVFNNSPKTHDGQTPDSMVMVKIENKKWTIDK